MKILGLNLCDYKRLYVSRIREVDIDTTSNNTQLIIGSNGSGKSSLMHELFPFPPIKSSFGKIGFKSLNLQHNNAQYRLTYDYTYGHQFFKDSVNLNVSGTNEIQGALIRQHFGITNDVHMILKGALPICSMVPSQRKKVLMGMNPIDISLFITKYQKVHKNVIAYSNNLDMLYARQKQLITQKLPEEQLKKMLEHKLVLENQEKTLLIWMTTVGGELNKYHDCKCSAVNDTMIERVYTVFKSLPRFSAISRSNYEAATVECKTRLDMIMTEIGDLETTVEDTITVLNDYELKKKALLKDENNVEEELSKALLKMKGYTFASDFNGIPEDLVPEAIKLIERVHDTLLSITYIEYCEILNKADLNATYRDMLVTKSEVVEATNQHSQSINRYNELVKTIRDYAIGGDCNRDGCELFSVYQTNNNAKQLELKELSDKITNQKLRLDELVIKYTKVADAYDTQVKLWEHIDRVLVLIKSNRHINFDLSDDYILSRIRESPMLMIDDLNRRIGDSIRFVEFTKLAVEVRRLELANASLASKKQLSMEILDTEIMTNTKRLDLIRKKYESKRMMKNRFESEIVTRNEFSTSKKMAYGLLSEVTQLEVDATTNANHDYLIKLYTILERLLVDVRGELIDLTRISREQELLIARLDVEVNSVIADIKPKYDAAKLVEKSLYDLPIKYTKKFVNNIIETTNYFISEIMTYPMHLIPVGKDEVCDFSFPAIINDDVVTKDISTCSEGQQAIIQLAFNLAMVIELKFNDYPFFSDEQNRSLDATHSRRLTDFLLGLVSKGIVSQLFVTNHEETMIAQLSIDGNIIVLNSENVKLPERYNQNTKIVYF